MESTCNNCDHWEQTQAKLNNAAKSENYGVCNELSDHDLNPEYIVPVLNSGKPVSEIGDHYDYVTGASFGCNHFEARM